MSETLPEVLGQAVTAALITIAAIINGRSHKKTRSDVETQVSTVAEKLAKLEAHVIGPDGRNGIRGSLAGLRSDFEREASAQGMARKETDALRLEWSLWRARLQGNVKLLRGRTKQIGRILHEDVLPQVEQHDREIEAIKRAGTPLKGDDIVALERRATAR